MSDKDNVLYAGPKAGNKSTKELFKMADEITKNNEMVFGKIDAPKEVSVNCKVDQNSQITIPYKNPMNKKPLEYVLDNGTPLIPMKLQLQKTIDHLPVQPQALWKQACSGDAITNDSWHDQWNAALTANEKNFDFSAFSCMEFYGQEAYKPVILAGSGPSIRKNFKHLKETYIKQVDLSTGKTDEVLGGGRGDIKIVSCLHNFPFFEDNEIMTDKDFYVNLDAGDITVREMTEGGDQKSEWYWEKTTNRTLITTVLACPELLRKWRGKIYFFKTASQTIKDYAERVDPSKVPTFSVGGNVLGASLYFAKAILGGGPMIFIGADFCFSYDQKFHGWDSQYDSKFAGVIPTIDIFGNRVYTWPSYYNFKCFFEYIATGGMGKNSQIFINCTEGGIFGAYHDGNIRHIQQLTLKEALWTFVMHTKLPKLLENAKTKKQEVVLF